MKMHVHTIKVCNTELFWIKMIDVQKGLGVKNLSDLVRKIIHGILKIKILQKNKLGNIKGLEQNGLIVIFISMFEVTLCQE